MTPFSSPAVHEGSRRYTAVAAALVAAVGLVALTGWFAGVQVLASWGERYAVLSPTSALLMLSWGSAVLLHVVLREDAFGAYLAALVSLIAAAFGLYGAAGALSGGVSDAGAAFFGPSGLAAGGAPVAPLLAVSWILCGLAILPAIRSPGSAWGLASNVMAGLLFVANLVVILGYLYGTPLLYGTGVHAVPLAGAVGFVLAAVVVMLQLGPDYYPLRFLTGEAARARLLRVFLPMIVVVIALDGVLAHFAPRQSGLNATTAASVLVFVGASIFIVYLTTRVSGDSIDRAEAERSEAEKRRLTTAAMFESLFNSVPDAVVVVDNAGVIARVNRAAETTFGYTREELIGAPIEMLIPERFRPGHYALRSGYADKPRVRSMGAGLNLFAVRKDGREFPVDIMLGPLNTELGPLVLAVVHDVSEMRRSQKEIEALNAALGRQVGELENVNKELESFSYSVSHDLRAPLRAVDGFSRILAEDYEAKLDDEGRRFLRVIQDNTRRMGQLIDDLLAFSRLGRQEIATAPIDMRELAQSVIDELTQGVDMTRLTFAVGDLPPARGDRAMVRQVFVNLIANAIKFSSTRPQARVEVGAEARPGETVYFVRDNGVGFDMAYAHKLFGVFQRLHRQQDFEGTGVGLAIVQRVVHRHGGRTWAEAKQGEGAVFYFALPEHVQETV